MKDVDPVLVVGGGPTGLLMAIWLKTLNPQTPLRIIDKNSGPSQTSKAIVVHARTIEFYRQIGLVDDLLEEGNIVQAVSIMSGGQAKGRLRLGHIGAGLSKYPFALSYPQDQHERLLIRHLKKMGVEVERNTELLGLDQHDGWIDADVNGKIMRASYVCGCDGGSSMTRKASGTNMVGGTYPQKFFVADVPVDDLHGLADVSISPGNPDLLIYIPLNKSSCIRFIGSVTSSKEGDLKYEDVKHLVERGIGEKCGEARWFSTYYVHHRVAETFQNKRVFYAGDAAHLHSPVGGQGMNTGLGDASNLAWKLSAVLDGKAAPEILDTYSPERRAFAEVLVSTTDRVFELTTGQGYVGWFLRRIFMPIIVPWIWAIPFVPRQIFETVSQIRLQYRHSDLSQGGAGKVCAGDRLPWVEGSESDNFASLAKLKWQFHIYGQNSAEFSWNGFEVLVFPFTDDVAATGLERDVVYLVRPDGYIGLCCRDFEDETLRQYIAKWGLSP